ncbi:MAG: hypothetical protein WCV91_00815 [Candidatus Margulisiibacteriota bacterium]
MAINNLNGVNMESAIIAAKGIASTDTEQFKQQGVEELVESREDIISKLSKEKPGETSVKVIRNLISSMASSGIELASTKLVKNTETKLKDEFDLMMKGKDDAGDMVKINSPFYQVQRTKGKEGDKDGQGEQNPREGELSREVKGLTKEYISTYGQLLVNGSTELKKKVEALEAKLQSNGVSPKELLSLKTNIKNSMRAELVSQIKVSFTDYLFSGKKGTMEYLISDWKLAESLNNAASAHRLGGDDFGNFMGGLDSAVKVVRDETNAEIKEYVNDDLTEKFVEAAQKGKADEKGIKELITLGSKVGFDQDEFLKNWAKKKDDLGLMPFVPPNIQSGLSSNSGFSQNNNSNQEEAVKVEERDLLSNQLRAVYMQRAIKGDFMTMVQTSFRMRKLKNGLIKLGLVLEDFKKLEKEGREVAISRSHEMLEEALAERATLYELSGPAFNLVEARTRSISSNLERLGAPIDKEDLAILIEKLDIKMHDLAMEELAAVEGMLKAGPDSSLQKKQGKLVKLINRLREEANIKGSAIYMSQVSDRT